ncbi:MAG: RsmD family RNA methyltransferase [Tannerellaceae bacterium]|jgi:16S rRNA (guanine(966)-N(2))-methyltransferase RsmD|nr:RsmD family RNA methyltransferase [Tannerellaceae bacterium]
MRIISGIYGSRRFNLPPSFNARPTTDFAKENLFNVLSNMVDWDGCEALDLFSGTGSIAFELLSRGCTYVTAVELNKRHTAFIAKVARELKTDAFYLVRGDAFQYLRSLKRNFDLIFADPPYAMKELPCIPSIIFAKECLRDGGLLIIEHSKEHDFSASPHFKERREYGSVNFSIFTKSERSL